MISGEEMPLHPCDNRKNPYTAGIASAAPFAWAMRIVTVRVARLSFFDRFA
jgi:hypothetical protein